MTYPGGREVTYTFDALGRIQQVATAKGGGAQTVVASVVYQPFGSLKRFTFGNGQTYTRGFDQDGRIASYTLATQTIAVGYDTASRISLLSETANPTNTNIYSYDSLDRLTGAVTPGPSFGYTYDAVGNRRTKTLGSATDTYVSAGTSNRLASIIPASGPVRTYTHDAIGATTADGLNAYSYDARGRLVQSVSGVGTTGYQVNSLGQRIRKTSTLGDAVYHYDVQGRLIAETTPAGGLLREYVYLGDTPVALLVNRPETTTTPTAAAVSGSLGRPVSLTVNVSGTSPTGTVTFREGSTVLGMATVSNGTASLVLSNLSIGQHTITATYSGDANNAPSTTNIQVTIHNLAVRADFNGDGKSDILWRHTDGTNNVWHVNGAVINGGVLSIASQGLLPTVADAGWSVAGIGDFNGDGKADILWRHTDGTNYVWMIDGATINGGVLTISSQGLLPAVPDPNWAVAGIGDFNGDGKSDILWRHADGTNYVWHVDGASITGGVLAIASQGLLPGADTTWSVAGVGDYNGDGKADILWRRNDGTNYVWHVDGASINGGVLAISSQGLLPIVDNTWSVVGVGDYNGDGKADVLWRRNDGTNYIWHVDGAIINGGVLSIPSQGLLPSVTDVGWSVVGAGDYNGGGKNDVLWRHVDGTNWVWHVRGDLISGGTIPIETQGSLPSVTDPGWSVVNPR